MYFIYGGGSGITKIKNTDDSSRGNKTLTTNSIKDKSCIKSRMNSSDLQE
jgi:hypothetical protein